MKLSIVATLYQSAPYICEFCTRVGAVAKQLVDDDYEIVLVNDGSPDDSLELAVALSERDEHIIVVDLSRNFGHYKAMMTGLAHAKGEEIFLIDSDLEEEPEWLLRFAEQMQKQRGKNAHISCDVVYGVQERRRGGWIERISGRIYYCCVNFLTGLAIPKNHVTARLMTRRYVQALLQHQEREMNMSGLWKITGFLQCACKVEKHSSRKETSYTWRKKVAVVVNAITSFSNAPLIYIFYTGLLISFLALVYTGYLLFWWLFMARPPAGWTTVISSIWILGGMLISFLGIIGIYLAKIFSEVKQRPYTIVRKIYGKR